MRIARLAALACCIAGPIALVGCKDDDMMMEKERQPMTNPGMSKADMMKVEDMMSEGTEMRNKGMKMKQDGDVAGGDKMIMEGDKMLMDAKMMQEKGMMKSNSMSGTMK